MRTFITISLLLFTAIAANAQEALRKYNEGITKIETEGNNDGRGKTLADFFYSRTAEVGKQIATKETVPHLRRLVDYDFRGVYEFLTKLNNQDDLKIFTQNHLSQDERTLVRTIASHITSNANKMETVPYPSNVPQPGYGLKGAWKNTAPTTSNTVVAQSKAQTDDGFADFNKGYVAYTAGNYSEAMNWYKQSAEKGNASAMLNLGAMYFNGKGVAQNYTEAMNWYKKSAEKGNSSAMYNVGTMYVSGKSVAQNNTEAMNWYKKSAEKGNALAMHEVGAMYRYGKGVTQNIGEAKVWYQKAFDKGYQYAKTSLQQLETNTTTSTSNTSVAHTKTQPDNGDAEFQKGSNAYKAANYSEAMKLLKQSAEKGHTNAMLVIGMMYYEGKGVAQNDTEAKAWFQKSADKGNESAKLTLQNVAKAENSGYEEFDKGVAFYKAGNYKDAFIWLKKSSDKGNADAMLVLAGMYVSGMGTIANITEAFNLYKKAAEKENTAAMYMAGLFYLEGQGVAKNGPEGIKWVKKSADKGYEKAKNRMQELDKDGRTDLYKGSEAHDAKNYTEAKKWYKQSADKGNQTAVIMLSALEKEMQISASIEKEDGEFYKGLDFQHAKNYTEAMIWLKKSADRGHMGAMYVIGTMYLEGQGVAKNETEAKKWYQQSANKGNEKAKEALQQLATTTTTTTTQKFTRFKGNNGKIGYKDGSGTIVIQPKYDGASPTLSNNVAVVMINDKCALIDATGKELTTFKYVTISEFSEDGIAQTSMGAYPNIKWGLIDRRGKELTPVQYDLIEEFSEGLARVSAGGFSDKRYGFIDKSGKEVIPVKYKQLGTKFFNGMVSAQVDGKYVFLDKTAKIALPKQYDFAEDFKEGLALVKLNNKFGFVDKTGKEIIPLKYDAGGFFSEGLAGLGKGGYPNNLFGFVDKTGKEVIPFKYNYIYKFSEGLVAVNIGGKWDESHYFSGGKWGFIDKTGKMIIPAQFDVSGYLYPEFKNGKAEVNKDNRTFFIDKTGKEVK